MPPSNSLQIWNALAHGLGQWGTDLVCNSRSAASSKVLSQRGEALMACAFRLREGSASWPTWGEDALRRLLWLQARLCMPATASQSARRC